MIYGNIGFEIRSIGMIVAIECIAADDLGRQPFHLGSQRLYGILHFAGLIHIAAFAKEIFGAMVSAAATGDDEMD